MADTISNKPSSIQIRNGLPSPLPDKNPSPATKLLLNHGKPNFTIARSPKAEENGNGNPLSPQPNANNNYNAYKSANSTSTNKFVIGTKFNGVFKPSNALNGNTNSTSDNEAAKVVLRRPKLADPLTPVEADDENVPEFIRRQRRIQERLAKENVLDFENRRSGYFTHVLISPDSTNRTSFVETMASPAIVPSLEMPAPLPQRIEEEEQQPQVTAVVTSAVVTEEQPIVSNGQPEVTAVVTSALVTEEQPIVSNGHSEAAPTNGHDHEDEVASEEVAKAIDEVIKAVAGEEEDKSEVEAEPAAAETVVESKSEPVSIPTPTPAPIEAQVEVLDPAQPHQNGVDESITISHTNGQSSDGPSIPAPDPSGALGVNYEPKTVVSFSQELGGGENNYPDTVKVVTQTTSETSPANGELQELSKLKFDIKADEHNQDVQVTPVLRAQE